MRKPLFVIICTLSLLACGHTDIIEKAQLADVWFKYEEPINGYDVTLHCIQAFDGEPNYFSLELFMKKDSIEIDWAFSELIALERIWKEEWREKDTIKLPNLHHCKEGILLDVCSIVYFEDIDFDGQQELILCMFPNNPPQDRLLDCENFLVFKITDNYLTPCHNSFIQEIEHGLCQTEFDADSKHKTIVLTSYPYANDCVRKEYKFRNGIPYQLDITHIERDNKKHYCVNLYDATLDSITQMVYHSRIEE